MKRILYLTATLMCIAMNCGKSKTDNPVQYEDKPPGGNQQSEQNYAKVIFISISPGGGTTVMLNTSTYMDLMFKYYYSSDAILYFTIFALDKSGNTITNIFPTMTWDVPK